MVVPLKLEMGSPTESWWFAQSTSKVLLTAADLGRDTAREQRNWLVMRPCGSFVPAGEAKIRLSRWSVDRLSCFDSGVEGGGDGGGWESS